MRASAIGFAFAALWAVQAQACGPGGTTGGRGTVLLPPLAGGIDSHLKDPGLPDATRAKVVALRSKIDELVRANRGDEARKVEEDAMAVLGYHKAWTPCGAGSFIWMRLVRL